MTPWTTILRAMTPPRTPKPVCFILTLQAPVCKKKTDFMNKLVTGSVSGKKAT
jgi:hypothetical protein